MSMLVPMRRNRSLWNELMTDPFDAFFDAAAAPVQKMSPTLMRTDIKETEDGFELVVDMPGFKKEEVNVELNNGYLTIEAAKSLDKDDTDKQGRYIRQERYAGSMSRSFYVGEGLEPKDIRAKFENGILQLSIPKSAPKQLPKTTAIAIE